MEYTPEQKEFIIKATLRIHDDPITRLSEITKNTLLGKNFVFDAHCHVFDGRCINVRYLAIRILSGTPEALKAWVWGILTGAKLSYQKRVLSIEEMMEQIYNEPDTIPDHDDSDKVLERIELSLESDTEVKLLEHHAAYIYSFSEFKNRIRTIIRLVRSNKMADVYDRFHTDYAIHNIMNDLFGTRADLVTVALGMDLESGWVGQIKKSNKQQNAELAQLAKTYPVIPFLPLDPRRADKAGDENLYNIFLKAFDQADPQFFGVKCYPALGYLPSDSRLKPIFEICAKKNIPVMTHCGAEIISTFDKEITVNRDGKPEVVKLPTRKARARFLNEPSEWSLVLDSHPGLKLCLSHFGGEPAWEKPGGVTGHRVSTILNFMNKYNVYSDFSFNLESQNATDNFVHKLTQINAEGEKMRERCMFGADFWVVLPMSDLNFDQRYFLKKVGPLKDVLLKDNVIKFLGLENI